MLESVSSGVESELAALTCTSLHFLERFDIEATGNFKERSPMPADIIDERGFFWWHGTPIPEGRIAPESAVPGRLRAFADGRSRIDLDGTLTVGSEFVRGITTDAFNPLGEDKFIQGVLKSDQRHVLPAQLHRNGGRLGAISFERFGAFAQSPRASHV